jgi:hypothetical protein
MNADKFMSQLSWINESGRAIQYPDLATLFKIHGEYCLEIIGVYRRSSADPHCA